MSCEPTKLSLSCQHQTDFSGNPLDADLKGVVSFLHPLQRKAECMTGINLREWLGKAPRLYLWTDQPLKFAPVFRLPYSRAFVQASAPFLMTFSCYQLESTGKYLIGNLSGPPVEKELFSAIPTHCSDFDNFISRGTDIPRMIQPFIPEERDFALSMFQVWRGMAFLYSANGGYSIQDPVHGNVIAISSNFSNHILMVDENKQDGTEEGQQAVDSILEEGIISDDFNTVDQALKAGADVSLGLSTASRVGNMDMINFLITEGRALPIQVALVEAERYGQMEIVEYLRSLIAETRE